MQQKDLNNGWMVIDLLDPSPVYQAREALEKHLAYVLGKPSSLEGYHECVENDLYHTDIQTEMTRFFRAERFGPRAIALQLPFFCELMGPDLCVQTNPYLRITRPGKPQDNIGYHRDTFYGGSPYELSVLIPFVDVPAESALSVLSGSHIHPESAYPTKQIQSTDPAVTKGSSKHQLGFLYAPKLMDSSVEVAMRPIPLKLGQALIFFLSTVHGSQLNSGSTSRWSTDIRIMHAFSPVDLSARPDYYELLHESTITQSAKAYLYANREKRRDDVELELCDTASQK